MQKYYFLQFYYIEVKLNAKHTSINIDRDLINIKMLRGCM